MFQDIRKKGSSVLVTLMFAAIIITFVISFGPGDDLGCSSRQNNAGTVNGEVISTSEFRFAYSNLYDYYQRMIRDFNNDMARQYNLSQKAMDGLIGEILVAQKAEELGYRVSDEEVSQEIMGNPYFQKNGVFDKEAYMNMVKFTLNTNVTAYEHRVRMQLLSRKLRSFILDNVSVSDTEAKDEFVAAGEKIDGFVYVFSDTNLKTEARSALFNGITDEDAQNYLKENEAKAKLAFDDNVSKYAKEGNESGTTTFDDVKIDVAKDLLVKPKLDEKIKADSAKLLAALKDKNEMTAEEISALLPDWEIAKREISGVTRRSTFVAGVGFSPKFVEKLYSNPQKGLLDEVFVTEEDRYVIASVTAHTEADLAEFDKSKVQIKEVLAAQKKAQIYETYVENLRKDADIQLNAEFLKIFNSTGAEG